MTSSLAFPTTNEEGSRSGMGTTGIEATREGDGARLLTEPGCLTSVLRLGVGEVLTTLG
jgi:hypothetical protein